MKFNNLYVLTNEGEAEFKRVFFDLKKFDQKKLTKKKYCSPIPNTRSFEVKNFSNSYKMAKEISSSLGGANNFFMHINNDPLWRWLTLVLYHQVLEGDGKGGKKIKTDKLGIKKYGESFRYDPAPITDYYKATRHIVRGAVFLLSVLGDESEFILSNPVFAPGELREQITQTALLVQEGMALTFKELYWDKKNKKTLRGHARQGPGGCRDLVRVMKQLMVTYGIEQLSKEKIIDLLPEYFHEEWLV